MSNLKQMDIFESDNSNKEVIVYSQITRKLYNEILEADIMYPVHGVTCNACTDKAERYLIDRLGFPFFFAWENLEDVKRFKGIDFYYTDDENSKYVLIKIKTSKFNTIRTSYYNYSDIIFLTECYDMEFINSDEFIKVCEEQLGSAKTIIDLIDDVFILEDGDLVQILLKSINKSEIEKVANLSDIIL